MFLPQPTCAPYPTQNCCPTTTQVPGPQGPTGDGTDGVNGISCFTFTTEQVLMPGVGNNVTIPVASSMQFAIGMFVWLEFAGEMKVISRPTVDSIELQNTGWAGNYEPGAPIPSQSKISPTGKSAGEP